MRLSKNFYWLLLFIMIFEACSKKDGITPPPPPPPPPNPPAVIQAPPPFGFYVVGYFPSYRSLTDIPDVKFKMCNAVNYASFSVNSTGTLTVSNSTLASQFITKAKANGAKAFLSINDGSGDGKTNF